MSQFDFGTLNPYTESGIQLASDLNSFRDSVHTTNSGSSRPSYVQQGTIWMNTATTPWTLYMFDGAQDIAIGTINATTDKFIPGASAIAAFDDLKQTATSSS